jgi:pimeloyl-ACP methyl ester carboxylesterase
MNAPAAPSPVLVRRRTDGPGPRVLLLHGLIVDESVWERTLALLPARYEIWTAQLPWRAEAVSGWTELPNLRGWLARALEAVPGRAEIVVAHSVASLVLLDLLDQKNKGGVDALRRFGIRALVLASPFYRRRAADFDWDTLGFYLNDFPRLSGEAVRIHTAGRLSGAAERALARRARDQVGPYGWLGFAELYLRTPALRTDRITVPTLVVSGADDRIGRPAESLALAAALPDAVARVLPGCGHFPLVEAADRFAAEIGDFVDLAMGVPLAEGKAVGT